MSFDFSVIIAFIILFWARPSQTLLDQIIRETDSRALVFIGDLDDQTEFDIGQIVKEVPITVSDNVSESKTIFESIENEDNLVFIRNRDPETVSDILLSANATSFLLNVVIVHGDTKTFAEDTMEGYERKIVQTRNRLGVKSQLYFIYQTNNLNVIQALGQAFNPPKLSECGIFPSSCNLSKAIEETRDRLDHGGQRIKLSYAPYAPFVITDKNGFVKDGFMPRVTEAICRMLNITPEYTRIQDVSGGKQKNGSWTGDFKDISLGIVDGSIWGYIVTQEREEMSTFMHPIVDAFFGFMIRTPRSDDISLMNYVSEFNPDGWLVFFVSNIGFWIMFWLLLPTRSSKKGVQAALITMLRTIINKGTPLSSKNLSVRSGFLVLMFMAMLVLFHYRAAMNSFLTAKVFRLPINSYEDVISTDMDLILHRGYYEENVFKFAPQGSLFKEVYNRKLLGKPRFHDYDGLEDVLERVKDGKAMYFTGTDAMMIRADYPCAMTDNKKIRVRGRVSIPLTKGSPFLKPFNSALSLLKEFGMVIRILDEFAIDNKDILQCEPKKTKLGYAQTFFPFMCLLVGVLLALVSVVAEKMPWISSQRRKLKERDVDRLKYMLQQKTQLEKDIDFLLKTAAEEDSDSN